MRRFLWLLAPLMKSVWRPLFVGLLSCALVPGLAAQAEPPSKSLWSDLPFEITNSSGKFAFNFWLDPKFAKTGEKVHVYMQKNPSITFEPADFILEGSQRFLVTAEKVGKDPVLVEIAATPDGGWDYFDRTVNFGFVGEMKTDPLKEIRSGEVKAFSLRFFDAQGKKTALKAPTLLRLIGSNAKLRTIGDKVWHDEPLKIWLQTGANSSPLVEATPKSFTGGEGRIQVELTSNDQYVLLSSDDLTFAAPPLEWLVFVMAILGGLLHAIYELVSALLKRDKTALPVAGAKAIIGILSGIIAVLFADKVGIKLDTTSLTGYVALGFLVAYIGVDTVLKKSRPT